MDEKLHETQLKITVDLVVFSFYKGNLRVLLIKRRHSPFLSTWALPSTQINIQEDLDLEGCAKRHLRKLVGLEIAYLEQVQTFGNCYRDPRDWSVAIVYYALVACEKVINMQNADTSALCWMTMTEALDSSLAFDHNQIVKSCLQRFQNKSLYTSLPIFLLPVEFTLTELQKAYETILDFKIEKKSFRRRLLDAGCITVSGNIRRASHRPAQLYRLAHSRPYFFSRIIEGVREGRNA